MTRPGGYDERVYRWIEHTGELELEIDGATEEEVFADALGAVAELLGPETDGPPAVRGVRLEAADRAGLLAAWIAELAFLGETEGLVPERATGLRLGGDGVAAEVHGRLGSPAHLIKAVTYHRLEFEPTDSGWRARAVLDV